MRSSPPSPVCVIGIQEEKYENIIDFIQDIQFEIKHGKT
jgi:hypothetical protein